MRLARARRTVVTVVAGSVLLTVVSWGIVAATTGTVASAASAAGASGKSCEPLQAVAASPSPTAKKTATPTPSPTHTTAAPTPTPTATTATPTPTPTTATPTPTPTSTSTASAAARGAVVLTAVIARAGAAAGASTAPVSLCVEVLPLQQSSQRGQVTQWVVSAWATGGNVPDATVRLQAAPAGAGTPHFSFGCGSTDGTASCNLGVVDAGSAQRQLQAQLTVPLTATTVTSASLMAIGGAANLHTAPEASASVTVLTPASPVGATSSLPGLAPIGVAAPTPTLSPGGSASGLFPTLDPSSPSPAPDGATPVANTSSAYTRAASPVGAEVAGLAALALAFIVAFTRLTIRRPVPAAGTAPPVGAPAEPASRPDDPGEPPAENAES